MRFLPFYAVEAVFGARFGPRIVAMGAMAVLARKKNGWQANTNSKEA